MSEEEGSETISDKLFWKNLAIKYWYMAVLLGIIIICTIIGFVLTANWYVYASDIGGYGAWTFGDFSLGTTIFFCLVFFLWLLLLVILPALGAAGLVIAILWFGMFSPDLREEIKARRKKREEEDKKRGRNKTEDGGGFSFLVFVGMCLYVWLDGNWLTTFDTLPISYFVNAWITVFVWMLIIFGIPILILGVLWFVRKFGEEDQEVIV